MRLLRYLRRRAALLDELETLRRENAKLRESLLTEQLWSWVRRRPEPRRRSDPHPFHPGRHRVGETATELAPRRQW